MKYKWLFYLELGVCFSVPILWTFFGLLFLPGALATAPYKEGGMQIPVMTACGIVGLTALFFIARSIVRPSAKLPRSVILWPMILAGFAPLLFMIVTVEVGLTLAEIFAFYLPLICAVHVVYLARKSLFST